MAAPVAIILIDPACFELGAIAELRRPLEASDAAGRMDRNRKGDDMGEPAAMDDTPAMTEEQVTGYMERHYPRLAGPDGQVFSIEQTRPRGARVRMRPDARFLRAGGTVSGPAMFFLADFAVFVALIGAFGQAAPVHASSLNINYLRAPALQDLIAEVRLIKTGKRLSVADVEIYSAGRPDMIAHATATYEMAPATT